MTRKHFNKLAEQFRITREESVRTPEQLTVWRECCKAVSRACRAGDPGFKPERFIEACERN